MKFPFSSVVVTGGAGFVGSNLAVRLKLDSPPSRVLALDNLKRRGSELNLPRLREAGVEFVHGDIRNREDLESLPEFDLMLECSAEPSVLAGYDQSPSYVVQTNLAGTLHCLESVRRNRAAVVFLSTSRVYPLEALRRIRLSEEPTRFALAEAQEVPGVSTEGVSEDVPMHGTRSLYGATKLASELILQEYLSMYGLRGVINRCGLLAGPWQMGRADQGVIALWTARHIFGRELQYIGYRGSGKQVRDFLHVGDLYDLLARQLSELDRHTGRVYNVGGGRSRSFSLVELTEVCRRVTGRAVPVRPEPQSRAADVPCYISDSRRVREAAGWTPRLSLEQTVEETARWMAGHERELKPVFG